MTFRALVRRFFLHDVPRLAVLAAIFAAAYAVGQLALYGHVRW